MCSSLLRWTFVFNRTSIDSAYLAQKHAASLEFFTISMQYKNAKIANFVLAVPFKIIKITTFATLKGNPFHQLTSIFTFPNILSFK